MTQSNEDKPDVFIYRMTADAGGAPCVHGGLISLCICKPRIRTSPSANRGDYIIGMGGTTNPKLSGRLIYIMQVKDCIDGKDYYKPNGNYWNRPDCIYEWDGQDYKWRQGAQYHQNGANLVADLGSPSEYKKAVCIIGDKFAYFGDGKKKNPDITKIRDIYKRLPRDFKKNHKTDYQKLISYIDCVLTKFGYGKHGEPTDSDKSKKCNETEGDIGQVQWNRQS